MTQSIAQGRSKAREGRETARDTVEENKRSKEGGRRSDTVTESTTDFKKRESLWGRRNPGACKPTAEGLMMPGQTPSLFTKTRSCFHNCWLPLPSWKAQTKLLNHSSQNATRKRWTLEVCRVLNV